MRQLGVLVLVSVLAGCVGGGSAAAAAEKRAGSGADALMLGRAASPALTALRSAADLDITRSAEVDQLRPQRYDMLVIDGHDLTADELRHRPTLQNFVAAGKWIAAFDVLPSDHDALRTYTGFDVADAERSDRSEMFVFRVAKVERTPTVEMINSGPYAQPGTADLGDRRKEEVRQDHLRRVARIVDREMTLDGAVGAKPAAATTVARKLKARDSCPDLTPPPSAELQHVRFCYVDTGTAGLPAGYWTEKSNPWWIDWASSSHAPGKQTPTWTMNHIFDVFLNNASRSGANGSQTVYYQLKTQFAPKDDNANPPEDFFRMDRRADKVTSGGGIYPERAWWTAKVEPRVIPDKATSALLDWQAADPRNANQETSYTSSEEFSVGFNASGTAGNLTNVAGGGGGFSLSYTTGKSETKTIPNWGVENLGTGTALRWRFSARHPCDATKTPAAVGDNAFALGSCFVQPTSSFQYNYPALPPDLSLKQNQFEASGRWQTQTNLDKSNGALTFEVATPVTLYDIFCVPYEFAGAFIVHDPCYVKRLREQTLVDPDSVTINVGVVNPIAIKELKLNPASADGTKQEKVTGTVILERPAEIPLTINVFSNLRNADVGTNVSGSADVTTDTITIDPTKSSGTFTILTNDNGLDEQHPHVTATISAFYTKPVRTQLTINR